MSYSEQEIEEAFKLVSSMGNVPGPIEELKSTAPTEEQYQFCYESMIGNGVDMMDAKHALWAIEDYFENKGESI